MEECKTPTMPDTVEFTFGPSTTSTAPTDTTNTTTTAAMGNDPVSKDLRNLMVNRISQRCYTPTAANDFRSPGLSPIPNMQAGENGGLISTTPTAVTASEDRPGPQNNDMNSHSNNNNNNSNTNNNNNNNNNVIDYKNQQQFCDSNSFNYDTSSASISASEGSMRSGEKSFHSAAIISHILNHTWSTQWLLNQVGLEKYAENFEKEFPDLDKFLQIKPTDLERLGIKSDQHCKIIMDLVNEMNPVY